MEYMYALQFMVLILKKITNLATILLHGAEGKPGP